MAVQMTYSVKRFTTLARVGGAGFRTIASLAHSNRPKRYERVYVMGLKSKLPI